MDSAAHHLIDIFSERKGRVRVCVCVYLCVRVRAHVCKFCFVHRVCDFTHFETHFFAFLNV